MPFPTGSILSRDETLSTLNSSNDASISTSTTGRSSIPCSCRSKYLFILSLRAGMFAGTMVNPAAFSWPPNSTSRSEQNSRAEIMSTPEGLLHDPRAFSPSTDITMVGSPVSSHNFEAASPTTPGCHSGSDRTMHMSSAYPPSMAWAMASEYTFSPMLRLLKLRAFISFENSSASKLSFVRSSSSAMRGSPSLPTALRRGTILYETSSLLTPMKGSIPHSLISDLSPIMSVLSRSFNPLSTIALFSPTNGTMSAIVPMETRSR